MKVRADSESFVEGLVRLSDAPTGSVVEVVWVEESPISPKLRAIGILPGVRIEVLRVAPMGEPKMYRVFNKVISLRNSEASAVHVRFVGESVLSLLQAPPGDYVVVRVDGGWMLRNHLANLGIAEGSRIKLTVDRKVQTERGLFDLGVGKLAKIIVRGV